MSTEGGPLPGSRHTVSREVTPELSARHLGSGTVGVFATPAMVQMMEGAAVRAVQDQLPAGDTTVGFIVNIRHLAPTPIGHTVSATAELTEVDGRRLKFRVEARDGDRLIGEGEHVRVIIHAEAFVAEAGR
ncbi:MAG: thioesterase family protein [Candidatus Dormibacteria bacterium]